MSTGQQNAAFKEMAELTCQEQANARFDLKGGKRRTKRRKRKRGKSKKHKHRKTKNRKRKRRSKKNKKSKKR